MKLKIVTVAKTAKNGGTEDCRSGGEAEMKITVAAKKTTAAPGGMNQVKALFKSIYPSLMKLPSLKGFKIGKETALHTVDGVSSEFKKGSVALEIGVALDGKGPYLFVGDASAPDVVYCESSRETAYSEGSPITNLTDFMTPLKDTAKALKALDAALRKAFAEHNKAIDSGTKEMKKWMAAVEKNRL